MTKRFCARIMPMQNRNVVCEVILSARIGVRRGIGSEYHALLKRCSAGSNRNDARENSTLGTLEDLLCLRSEQRILGDSLPEMRSASFHRRLSRSTCCRFRYRASQHKLRQFPTQSEEPKGRSSCVSGSRAATTAGSRSALPVPQGTGHSGVAL